MLKILVEYVNKKERFCKNKLLSCKELKKGFKVINKKEVINKRKKVAKKENC